MSKLYIIVLALLFIQVTANSQNSLSGKVGIKETENPLPGAIIYLPDLKQGTVANADGKFRFNNLPSGNFLVEIRSMGYKSYINYVKITGNITLDVALEESAVEMNEVVVTGSVMSTQKLLNPIPVVSLTEHELERNSALNVVDGLTRVPGVAQISTGNAISKPVIRGLGYNRVLVLHDDIRQEGQQWGDEHGVEIDDNSIDKVEIIKGPGSLMYGSDALAGVLNFISTPTLPSGKIQSTAQANFQSNNNLMDYSLNNQGNINGVNWLIRGTYKKAGNYRNRYDDLVYNSGYNEKNLNGYLGLTKSWGYSFLRFSTFNQELGIIEGERNENGRFISFVPRPNDVLEETEVSGSKLHSYDIDVPRQEIRHNRVQLNSKFLLREGSIQTDFGFQNNVRKEFADFAEPNTEELHFALNTFNYQLKYILPDMGGWQNIAGIGGMTQQNRNKGEEQLIPDYNLNDLGLFLTTQKTWEKLHLAGGIRYDNRYVNSKELLKPGVDSPSQANDYKFEGFKKHFSNITLGIGVTRNITKSSVIKLNYSNGYRAPNLAELATNGKHEGTFRYEYGNKSLKPEFSHQLDAGVTVSTHHFSVEITPFVNSIQHYIYLNKLTNVLGSDSIPDPEDPAPAYQYKQGNALLYGGEISMDLHPHPFDFIHLQQSFSLVRGILKNQTDSTRNLPFMPAPNYRAEIRIQKIQFKRLKNPYALLEYNYYFKQNKIFSAYGTETPTPSYALLNFSMGAEVTSAKNETLFSVYFMINNIADVGYQNHLSRLKYAPENLATGRTGIYNPGRNFSIKIEVPIVFKGSKNIEE
jgi:iron complex outermembrane receptor protein